MNTGNTTRDPLTVPVSEATLEERSAQARHHAMSAANRTLKDFPNGEFVDLVLEHFGDTVAARLISSAGEERTESVHIIWLHSLADGEQIVFLRPLMGRDGNYAIAPSPSDIFFMEQTVAETCLILGLDAILAAAHALNDIIVRAQLIQADNRLASATS